MACELAGDVAEFILKKAAGKVVGDAVTKIQDKIFGPSKDQQELDQLKALSAQVVKLEADEKEIINKLDTILLELKESFIEAKADDAKNQIKHLRQHYRDYIVARISGASRDSWPEINSLSAELDKQLFNYHTALVDPRGISPCLIELTVEHFWDKYEKAGKGQPFDYNLFSIQKDLIEFLKHILGVQFIGLNLLSMLSQDEPTRQQYITRQSKRFEKQALIFKDNIPSCVDLSRVDCDEFLTRSPFRLQWWDSEKSRTTDEYLSSVEPRWYSSDFLPWPTPKTEVRILPFLSWNPLVYASITEKNSKALEWKFKKDGAFYLLTGYSVERFHPNYTHPDQMGRVEPLDSPTEMNVTMEPGARGYANDPGLTRSAITDAEDRYTIRQAGNSKKVVFKVILMRSKMKKSNGTFHDKPIVRIVDTYWWDWSDQLHSKYPVFNADTGDYYVHQMNYI